MKVFVIIFCFVSTKSVLGMNGFTSPQHLIPSRRRFSSSNPFQRLHPEMIKLIFLKRLLEMGCVKNIYYRNCDVDRFFKQQKFSSGRYFGEISGSKKIRPVVINNGFRKKYFMNPKLIMLPPVKRIGNNIQNPKEQNDKKNFQHHLRILPEETKDDKNEELLQIEENIYPFSKNMPRSEENDTLLHQSPVTYSQITSDLILSPKPTQIYEVEEIIEDTVNINENNFNNIRISDHNNNIKSHPNEKKIIDNSILTILKEINEPDMRSAPSGNTVNENIRTKAPVQSFTATKLQNSSIDIKKTTNQEIISGKGYPDIKNYSNRGIIQPSFPIKKEENVKSYEGTPIVNERKQESEEKKKSVPQTLFGFFNKKPTENIKLAAPEKPSLFTSLKPFTNIPARNQHFLKNLVKEDDNEELFITPGPPPRIMSQNLTTSVLVNNVTMVPRALNTHSPSMFETTEELKITTEILQSITSSNKISNSKEFTDAPLSVNLLSTTVKSELKKEQESIGKNSRKMHFGQEKVLNSVTNNFDLEPRRSDILITDDYKENDNWISTKTYFEKLYPNGTIDDMTNTTVDSLIPLIPEILNDIREDKISPQDLSLLSTAFGKYWSSILALTNNTELDILPLLTMRNEEDLINILNSHLFTETKTSTTEINEVKLYTKDFQKQYDYLDEYKDLYDYVLEQDQKSDIETRNRKK